MNRRDLIVTAATTLALPSLATRAHAQILSESAGPLARSKQFVLKSRGREFLIQIAEPERPVAPGAKAGAIYALDGNLIFLDGSRMVRGLEAAGRMRSSYVIGVGYPTESMEVISRQRIVDYMHNRVASRPGSGGGAAFEAFLVSELKPMLEARLPLDPKCSVLGGNSLGGLFASALLVRNPGAFSGYMVGSPSFELDPAPLKAAASLKKGAAAPKVFIAGSDEEGKTAGAWWTELQRSYEAAGYASKLQVFDNTTHTSVVAPAVMTALPYLAPPQ